MDMPKRNLLSDAIAGKIARHFGQDARDASKENVFKACALVARDVMTERLLASDEPGRRREERRVHYLSLEFLMGRSLAKNIYNLGLWDAFGEALNVLGFDRDDILETEADAGLGNGGLGRLAACYLDSLATLGIPATGYSICYEYGLFKQKIIDGGQFELPDAWLHTGDVWLIADAHEAKEVRFGGSVEMVEENGKFRPVYTDGQTVLAVPMDMPVAGFDTKHACKLRLWSPRAPVTMDFSLFSQGEYLKAMEQKASAEVIAKVLYPADHTHEGKSLRLKQQYFFVSATAQDILHAHKKTHGTVRNFHTYHVLHINDTHPSLIIPELMRLLLDEEGLHWDEAWRIVTQSVSYTNHTVMPEALECWTQDLVRALLPRIHDILCEINGRLLADLRRRRPDQPERYRRMAIVWDGVISMANLCVAASFSVNGVSALHSGILTQSIFEPAYELWPQRFRNVTNGVDHRRWLTQVNPLLDALIKDLIGPEYQIRPEKLAGLAHFDRDASVLKLLGGIKQANKQRLAAYLEKSAGVRIDPGTMFDVQVKRLHLYKRQLLNILHVIALYQALRDDPNLDFTPRTFIFGGKAAPSYHAAKRIIRLIGSVSEAVRKDPRMAGRLQVHFWENYRVSVAEMLMPATDLSEQISLAGYEASGTGNMKFMMNGAVTLGTLDGANVEMAEAVGRGNIIIFGLRSEEVNALKHEYIPSRYTSEDPRLRAVLENLSTGFGDGETYEDIVASLMIGAGGRPDEYMVLADFDDYARAHREAGVKYLDQDNWQRMALRNIAASGRFAADRSVRDYARDIWKVRTRL